MANNNEQQMLFGKINYILMIVGILLVIVGFALMAGGKNPADAWSDAGIYSPRRITLAPILVLTGFIVEIIAIMKKPSSPIEDTTELNK